MRNYETKTYDYVDKKTGQHIVKAITMYAGKRVCAVAKCDPRDTFDLEFGTELALKRLEVKIAEKRAASMKAYAAFCRENLKWIEIEKQRVQKALTKAEVAYTNRMMEAEAFTNDITNMLSK